MVVSKDKEKTSSIQSYPIVEGGVLVAGARPISTLRSGTAPKRLRRIRCRSNALTQMRTEPYDRASAGPRIPLFEEVTIVEEVTYVCFKFQINFNCVFEKKRAERKVHAAEMCVTRRHAARTSAYCAHVQSCAG